MRETKSGVRGLLEILHYLLIQKVKVITFEYVLDNLPIPTYLLKIWKYGKFHITDCFVFKHSYTVCCVFTYCQYPPVYTVYPLCLPETECHKISFYKNDPPHHHIYFLLLL